MANTKGKKSGGERLDSNPEAMSKEKSEELRVRGLRIRDNIFAVLFIVLGVFLVLAFQTSLTGSLGSGLGRFFNGCFGMAAFILPYYLIVFGILIFVRGTIHVSLKTVILSAVVFLMIAIINSGRFIDVKDFEYYFGFGAFGKYYSSGVKLESGGLFGMYFGSLLAKLLKISGMYIFSAAVIAVCLLLVINTPISRFFARHAEKRRFRKEEEAEIERHNHHFYRESPLEDEFAKFFRLPTEDEKPEAVWMSAGDIFDRLKCSAPKTLQGITVHRMGKLLRRMGAQKVHTVYGNRYAVIERDNHPAA